MNLTKGQVIFGVGSALLITGVVYFGFIKKYSNGLTWYKGLTADKEGGDIGAGNQETSKSNFQKLAANLGVPVPSGDIIKVKFNENKNQANFLNNNRVAVYRLTASGQPTGEPLKGTYSDGGRTILRDRDGAQITTSSTYQTLFNMIK